MKNERTPVNYIRHLTGVFSLFYEDERLTPFHISLYMTLFHEWNISKFDYKISIARSEMMRFSKIGSKNTYIKCLKQLHAFGYLEYLPSKNNIIGSKVIMYRFDTTDGIDKLSCPISGTSSYPISGNTSGTTLVPKVVTRVGRSLNNIKHINIINKREGEFFSVEKNSSPKKIKKNENSSLKPKLVSVVSKIKTFSIPQLDDVQNYFLEKESTNIEAEKFHNYFESNGWLVGGKTKMKDWKAAARNWMLNVKQFAKNETTSSHLHVNENKRYDIPL